MATATTNERRTVVRGLGEIALRVNNLDAMQKFYEEVMCLPLMTRFPNVAFFKIADGYGGHIQVLDVAGDLTAFTGGGHINVGNISGDAALRTGGGHIRAGQIGGRAELETVGGNITVARAGNFVSVRTGGGQIDFGEVRGSVHAQTGGGGIRVMYVSGPMELESSSGSICLTRVAGALQAATSGGTITAWINPDSPSGGGNVRLAGASQLNSGNGDIVVFLPRNLAANIDATVANGSTYYYAATAVDIYGHESSKSASIKVSVP